MEACQFFSFYQENITKPAELNRPAGLAKNVGLAIYPDELIPR